MLKRLAQNAGLLLLTTTALAGKTSVSLTSFEGGDVVGANVADNGSASVILQTGADTTIDGVFTGVLRTADGKIIDLPLIPLDMDTTGEWIAGYVEQDGKYIPALYNTKSLTNKLRILDMQRLLASLGLKDENGTLNAWVTAVTSKGECYIAYSIETGHNQYLMGTGYWGGVLNSFLVTQNYPQNTTAAPVTPLISNWGVVDALDNDRNLGTSARAINLPDGSSSLETTSGNFSDTSINIFGVSGLNDDYGSYATGSNDRGEAIQIEFGGGVFNKKVLPRPGGLRVSSYFGVDVDNNGHVVGETITPVNSEAFLYNHTEGKSQTVKDILKDKEIFLNRDKSPIGEDTDKIPAAMSADGVSAFIIQKDGKNALVIIEGLSEKGVECPFKDQYETHPDNPEWIKTPLGPINIAHYPVCFTPDGNVLVAHETHGYGDQEQQETYSYENGGQVVFYNLDTQEWLQLIPNVPTHVFNFTVNKFQK